MKYVGWGLATGVVLGAVAGVLGMKLAEQQQVVKGEQVLEEVKAAFLVEGPIEGSWIELKKKPLQKFALKYQTYLGGITRLEDGALVQYEFLADAKTGTVLDLYRLD